ncbi:hypothetical protein Vretimale_2762 [Volvox reticuliferus]|uniref:Uncharacterized protein n=1 Tax=Volvox reticuliferus TaxID=1737510 RepID=A0A8J4BYU1_9CHLO|nr:hypothetical protein Vretifemale_1925 [Volvox reticuliferus]GIL97059.1 hypothetical protein Vretimale_2762 [Volvox reticuliferus]
MQWVPCAASIHGASVTTARFGHTAVCISGTGSVWGTDLVVVFGGVSYSDSAESALDHHAALADVTVLQAEGDMWFAPQVSPATAVGPLPEPRAFHCAAAVDRRMYVFGGHVMSYDSVLNKKRRRFFNDLWCLDTDTWTWQCVGPVPGPGVIGMGPGAEAPSRRDMATLTRAGASCLLLFGGRLESGRVAGDAWVLDTNTHTWSQLRMPGPTPPPRKMHSAVYVTNRVVIFGGERDTGLLDDLWTLKGVDGAEPAKWTQIKLRPAPPGRFGHAMAACGSRLAVFGGCLDHSTLLSFSRTYVQCNELWVLDMATFSWHRVEVPEGVTSVSGQALEDPHLLPLLQQQAQESEEEEEERPISHRLLALPLERMCHSLVTVGPEATGRLLLLGGRKREGICEDAWWLTMGPDNLTPTLIVPRPETLAAALNAIRVQRPARHRAQPPPQQPAAAATTTAAAPQSLAANPSLLSTLLRKSQPPAGAPVASAHHHQQQQQQQQQQLAAAQQVSPGRPSGGGSSAKEGGSVPSSSGPSLTAVSAPLLAASNGSQRMAVSKSAGSITLDPAAAAAAAVLAQPSINFTHAQHPQGQGNGGGGGGAGRERVADAITRITSRITNTIRWPDTAGRGGPAAPAVTSPPPAAVTVVRSPSYSSPAQMPLQGQSPPPPPQPQPHGPGSGSESKTPPASPSGLAVSVPPDVRDPLERLRSSLGLPPLGSPSSAPSSPGQVDPGQALAALGRRLAEESAEGCTPETPRPGRGDAVSLARQQLVGCPPERLTVAQLGLVLADCQALLKARTAAAWDGLERETHRSAVGQTPHDSSGIKGPSDGAGTAAPERTALTCLVSSSSHWLNGVRPGELRLADVPRMMASYAELLG